ncbi:K02A2.6-like [Cordylochernes scorpioides]|uniref:RNA-directed DNA polymerase n=1 Tax=Cordylochernes scorpioides TaxID=51811 RepID=A0ABY6L8X1_9ARAC|nr:K02A2.6-like [Cordylochernes scorpioides]
MAANLTPPLPMNMNASNLFAEYKHWMESYAIFEIASGISKKSDEIKRATLLHCLGPNVQRIFFNLPDGKENYEQTKMALDKYFTPHKNVVTERFKFRQRVQKDDESIDNYLISLREPSKSCEFGNLEADMIRDQIIEKCNNKKLKEKLLQQENLTLSKTIDIARMLKISRNEIRLLEPQKDQTLSRVQNKPKKHYNANNFNKEHEHLFHGLGTIKGYSHKVTLKDNYRPIAQRCRRIPYAMVEAVNQELDKMLENGIIEEVHQGSKWVSNIIVVPKRDSEEIRLCIDLREVNKAILRERHPIPTIDNMLHALKGAKVFAKLDAKKKRFWQVDLDPQSRPLTTFITHRGCYRFCKVPFGLSSAPEAYQKGMDSILLDLKGVMCYLDDVVVYAKDRQELEERLRRSYKDLIKNQRLSWRLQPYDFEIEFIQGKQNIADIFSRQPLSNTSDEKWLEDYVYKVLFITSEELQALSLKEIKVCTEQDPLFQKLKDMVQKGVWPYPLNEKFKCFYKFKDELSIFDNLILKGSRILLPSKLIKRVLRIAHETHQGMTRTKQLSEHHVILENTSINSFKLVNTKNGKIIHRNAKHLKHVPSQETNQGISDLIPEESQENLSSDSTRIEHLNSSDVQIPDDNSLNQDKDTSLNRPSSSRSESTFKPVVSDRLDAEALHQLPPEERDLSLWLGAAKAKGGFRFHLDTSQSPEVCGLDGQRIKPFCFFGPGEESFEIFVQRFEAAFEANALEEGKRMPIFVSLLDSEMLKLGNDLFFPSTMKEQPYERLIERIKLHLAPRKKVIPQRCRFLKRIQLENESVSEYLRELRHLAMDCTFGEMLEVMLRDRFVAGIKSGSLQKKLLQEDDDVTLDRVFSMAVSFELAEQNAKELQDGLVAKMDIVPGGNRKNEAHRGWQHGPGSPVTLIPKTIYEKYWKDGKLSPSYLRLRSFCGNLIKIIGERRVFVKEANQDLRLIVVDEDISIVLLGREWLKGLNLDFSRLLNIRQARSLPFSLKKKVENEIDGMVNEGILQPIEYANWAAPIVPVLKKDGSLKICGDFRCTANKAIELNKYPLPSIDEIFSKLSGNTVFSSLDLSRAYLQVRLSEEAKRVVNINTTKGLFAFKRLPYGVAVAPNKFQREMDNLFADMSGVACYIDDILVAGKDHRDHEQKLELVFKRLQEKGLRLNKDKCKFAVNAVEYLGFKIDKKGLHPISSKIEAVVEAPEPTNVSQLRSFIGLLMYYSRFIRNISDILAPFYHLLKKNSKWNWTGEHRILFAKCKALLTNESVLAHYDTTRELVLACDASSYGLGVVLSHRNDRKEETPIDFASRTLTEAERRRVITITFSLKTTESLDEDQVLLLRKMSEVPFSIQDVAIETRRDKLLSIVLRNVRENNRQIPKVSQENPLYSYYRIKDELSCEFGCLQWRERVVIPQKLRSLILNDLHEMHLGMVKMKMIARRYFWWPGIDKNIEELTRDCRICQESANAYTKWLEIVIIKDITSRTIIGHLREIFARFGLPDLCTNGLAERYIREFKNSLRKNQGKDSVEINLQRFLFAHRDFPKTILEESPAELLMKRNLRSRFSNLIPKMAKVGEVYHDAMRKQKHFAVGSDVYFRSFANGPKWKRGRIMELLSSRHYLIEDEGRYVKRHINQLRPVIKKEVPEVRDLVLPGTSIDFILPGTSRDHPGLGGQEKTREEAPEVDEELKGAESSAQEDTPEPEPGPAAAAVPVPVRSPRPQRSIEDSQAVVLRSDMVWTTFGDSLDGERFVSRGAREVCDQIELESLYWRKEGRSRVGELLNSSRLPLSTGLGRPKCPLEIFSQDVQDESLKSMEGTTYLEDGFL